MTRILFIPHSLSPVGHEQEALPLEGGLLGLDDLLDARVGQAEEGGEVLPRKGLSFRSRLDLYELAAVGLDDVHVERGLGIFGVVEVQELPPADDPDADAGDEVPERHLVDLPFIQEFLQRHGQGHAAGGDRGHPGSAVGLDDVAVDDDRPLAQDLQVGHGAERPPDQPLDLLGPP